MQSVPNDLTAFDAGVQEAHQRLRFLIDMRLKQLQDTPGLKNRQQLSDELHRIRQYCESC